MSAVSRFVAPLLLLFLAAGAAPATAADAAPRVERVWARPTPPGAKVGGVFLRIHGAGKADRLVSASTPAAASVELHAHVMADGVAAMRAVPAIDVPPTGIVELKPGGLHLMLIGLKAPLRAGQKLSLKLRFAQAGEKAVAVEVGEPVPVSAEEVNRAASHAGHTGH